MLSLGRIYIKIRRKDRELWTFEEDFRGKSVTIVGSYDRLKSDAIVGSYHRLEKAEKEKMFERSYLPAF